MGTFRSFEDMETWKKARGLSKEIYDATKHGAFARDFGLRDQIRKAAVSVMSNIAEGFERGGRREFMQFLSVAKGSAGELRSQLYAALDQSYLSEERFLALQAAASEISRMIGGLIRYLRKTRLKGAKFLEL